MTLTLEQNVAKGIVMMLLAVFFFSIMDTSMKWLSYHYSPFQVSFFRGLCSLPFVMMWFAYSGRLEHLKTGKPMWHLVRGVMSVLFLVGVVIGLRELTLANAYAIFFSAPLLVALLSILFLNEKVGIKRWSSIIIGLIGVLIALNPKGEGFFSLGAVACLFGVVGYSVVVIVIKKMSTTETTFAMVFYFLLSLTLGCGVLSIFDWKSMQWEHWSVLLALGLSGSIGQYLITEAFRLAPVSVITPLDYSALIWGALFGYLIWYEVPALHVWLGAAIIIGSGLYLMIRESKVKPTQIPAKKVK